MRSSVIAMLLAASCLLAVGCTSDDERMGHTGVPADDTGTGFGASRMEETCNDAPADAPLVVGASAVRTADGWTASARVCSLYDGPDRYADAWRVTTPDGTVLAVRELTHDHAAEQPFERSLTEPFDVPDDVDVLVFEVRDQRDGWVAESALEVSLDTDT